MNVLAFRVQLIFLYCSLVLDVVLNGVGGTINHQLSSQIGTLFVQGLNLFVNMICSYLLLARSWFFEAGLFGLLVSKFRGIFWIMPLNFLLTMGMRGFYIALALNQPSIKLVWQNAPIFVLGVIQKLVSVLFYIMLFRLLLRVGESKLYKPTADEVEKSLRAT